MPGHWSYWRMRSTSWRFQASQLFTVLRWRDDILGPPQTSQQNWRLTNLTNCVFPSCGPHLALSRGFPAPHSAVCCPRFASRAPVLLWLAYFAVCLISQSRMSAYNTRCRAYHVFLSSLVCRVYYLPCLSLAWRVTCLITPWSKALPEKLTGPQLVGKFTAFYATLKFITTFPTIRHLSLYSPRSIQSMRPSHFSKIDFNIILPSMPGSSKLSPSLSFPHHNPVRTSLLSHTCYIPCLSQSSWFDHPNNICWRIQSIKLLVM